MRNSVFDLSEFEVFEKNESSTIKGNSAKPVVATNTKPRGYNRKPEIYERMNDVPSRSSSTSSKNISVTSDIGAIANAISGVINSIGNIVVSINEVRKEQEVTKQVKAQANMIIAQEKQMTKRFIVEQKEQTKRVKANLINDYKKAQLSLIGKVKELEFQERELIRNHDRKMKKLDYLIMEMKKDFEILEQLNAMVLEVWARGELVNDQILDQITEIRNKRLEFIRLIVEN